MPVVNGKHYAYTSAGKAQAKAAKAAKQKEKSTAVDGFRSQQEVVRAMADERYDNDPAYRKDVYDKLERSNIQF